MSEVANCPAPSKYRICAVVFEVPVAGIVMPYKLDAVAPGVGRGTGAARRSLRTLAIMLVAAVWEVALRFVCTPIGIKPNTAIKQKAAIPNARVTSTSENAWIRRRPDIISCKF